MYIKFHEVTWMNIVLLESLGVPDALIAELTAPLLQAGHTFARYERTDDEDELIRRCEHADVVMLANMPLSGRVIRACKALKFIDIAFTGVDHVDLDAAREMGAAASNAAGYSTQAVAELTLGQMLALLRNVPAVDKRCREGGTKAGLVGRELGACTVGIVGTGAIGLKTAQLAKAFGSRVIAYAPRPKAAAEGVVEYVSLEELLKTSDIVCLHCPLNAETRGMIGREQLAMMRKDAYLINMARGPVVDTDELAKALKAGKIRASVDVYEKDPPFPEGHPLLGCPNLVCTPHVGFDTKESIERRAEMAFENVSAWISGKPVRVTL